MPSLGADMDAGVLTEWRVRPGDHVTRGQIVALVETQKGIVEIEIWETGIIDELRVSPGAKVPVGTVLATLRGEGAKPKPKPPAPAPAPVPSLRASPAARQLARERGVALETVTGTGPHGVITREDVEKAHPAPEPVVARKTDDAREPSVARPPKPSSAMRDAIAAAMTRAKREIPHYYLSADIDVSRAEQWLEAENASRPVTERVLFAAVLLKATALALREVPELNGHYVDGAFRAGSGVHLGVAISLRGGGLVAPAIHDVDKLAIVDVMRGLHDLVERARSGSLRSSEMSDPTITVTNLGDQGTDVVFPVIYPPQVAIVGFGRVRERPWAAGGMLGVRPIVSASLAADHRVTDGHRGARFLTALGRLLEEPEALK